MKKRFLYLRPFRSTPDSHVTVALTAAISRIGKLIAVGPSTDRLALQSYWKEMGLDPSAMANFIQHIECASNEWKQVIHREIQAADCIFIFIAPKAESFPLIKEPENQLPRFEEYHEAPFKDLSTGIGLLYELAYLDRLGKVGSTVAICRKRESEYVRELIHRSSLDALFFKSTDDGFRAVHSRLLAPDRQLARLRGAAGLVSFSDGDLDAPQPRFGKDLQRTVKVALRRKDIAENVLQPSWQALLGISPTPRPLPPDNRLKIISHTRVENLLHIPSGEITEVPSGQARRPLKREALQKGCPTCGAGLANLFFYVNGLQDSPRGTIRVKCQKCMAYLQIAGQFLIEV